MGQDQAIDSRKDIYRKAGSASTVVPGYFAPLRYLAGSWVGLAAGRLLAVGAAALLVVAGRCWLLALGPCCGCVFLAIGRLAGYRTSDCRAQPVASWCHRRNKTARCRRFESILSVSARFCTSRAQGSDAGVGSREGSLGCQLATPAKQHRAKCIGSQQPLKCPRNRTARDEYLVESFNP